MTSYLDLSKEELIALLQKKPLSDSDNDKLNAQSSNTELLKTVLDTIDEPIYIVDLKTDEIIFSNQKTVDLFGPVVGKKCWLALQKGRNKACSFCTNKYLLDEAGQPTGTRHSTHLNLWKEKWFQCCDQAMRWHDGRMVAVKTSIDISALKSMTSSLNKLLIENKKLTQDIVISTDNERRQLSQDIHDEIGQIGTAIKLNADFLAVQSEGRSSAEVAAINEIITLSEQFLNAAKDISIRLNPRSIIMNFSINEVLQGLFDDWSARNSNITGQISFNTKIDASLPVGLKETLYRTMQEALTNITRHAAATRVNIVFSIFQKQPTKSELKTNSPSYTTGRNFIIDLTISDDGQGFPQLIDNRCLGLRYMDERVKALSGSLSRESSATGGAQIHIQLPYLLE
jgi:signal transduction histidine kinase